MAKLIGVIRSDEYQFERRQLPLQCDDTLSMIIQFEDTCVGCTKEGMKQKELERFVERFHLLTNDEIAVALMVTNKEIFSLLSQMVPCVGCRRSVERLFNQLAESGHPAFEPLIITKIAVLSIKREYLFDPKALFALFYIHGTKLSSVVEAIPKSKKNKRCVLHSLDSHTCKTKTLGVWMEVWELLSTECREEVVLIECDALMETVENYLRKHRFCTECKSKVLKAYNILIGDVESKSEKGYVAALFEGLRCCQQEKHIHVLSNTDFMSHLITRAEPELMGSRRERHAKTLDIAQEEVLTCLGIHLYERLHKIWQKLRAEEQTWQVMFYLGVDALKKNFEVALEKKRGISNLELICEELLQEEQAKEQRRELKKKKRKQKKNNKNNSSANIDNTSTTTSTTAIFGSPLINNNNNQPNIIQNNEGGKDSCGMGVISSSVPVSGGKNKKVTIELEKDKENCSCDENTNIKSRQCNSCDADHGSRQNSPPIPNSHHQHSCHVLQNTPKSKKKIKGSLGKNHDCADCTCSPKSISKQQHQQQISPTGNTQPASSQLGASTYGDSCNRSDCGYSSGQEGCDNCSIPSSRDGSDVACSEGICNHDGDSVLCHKEELADVVGSCKACDSSGSPGASPQHRRGGAAWLAASKCYANEGSRRVYPAPGVYHQCGGHHRHPQHGAAAGDTEGLVHTAAVSTTAPLTTLQDMLQESCSGSDEEADDFISEEEIQRFKANQKSVNHQRSELRDVLRQRFANLQMRNPKLCDLAGDTASM